jgi:parallel beta-helix repeat protein
MNASGGNGGISTNLNAGDGEISGNLTIYSNLVNITGNIYAKGGSGGGSEVKNGGNGSQGGHMNFFSISALSEINISSGTMDLRGGSGAYGDTSGAGTYGGNGGSGGSISINFSKTQIFSDILTGGGRSNLQSSDYGGTGGLGGSIWINSSDLRIIGDINASGGQGGASMNIESGAGNDSGDMIVYSDSLSITGNLYFHGGPGGSSTSASDGAAAGGGGSMFFYSATSDSDLNISSGDLYAYGGIGGSGAGAMSSGGAGGDGGSFATNHSTVIIGRDIRCEGGRGSTSKGTFGGPGGDGGSVFIDSAVVRVSGAINVSGNDGANGGSSTGGDAGSGGNLTIDAKNVTLDSKLHATGGIGGNSSTDDGGAGGSGGRLLITIDNIYFADDVDFSGGSGGPGGSVPPGDQGGPGGAGGNASILARSFNSTNITISSSCDFRLNGGIGGGELGQGSPAGNLNLSAADIYIFGNIYSIGGSGDDSSGGDCKDGGSGGDMMLIADPINITGEINVSGGDGGDASGFGFDGGDGGDAGNVTIISNSTYITGIIGANKGLGGTAGVTGIVGSDGTDGNITNYYWLLDTTGSTIDPSSEDVQGFLKVYVFDSTNQGVSGFPVLLYDNSSGTLIGQKDTLEDGVNVFGQAKTTDYDLYLNDTGHKCEVSPFGLPNNTKVYMIPRDCDAVCTSGTEWGCCDALTDCNYNGTCYDDSYEGDVDNDGTDEACTSGTWTDGLDSGANISFITAPADGSVQSGTYIYLNISANGTSNISVLTDLDNTILAWWRMDDLNSTGDVVDYMGMYNGSVVDDASQTSSGILGKAFEFDGDGDYIDVKGFTFSNATTERTISAWFKLAETDASSDIHTIVRSSSEAGDGINDEGISLFYRGDTAQVYAYNSTRGRCTVYGNNPVVGIWYNFVAVQNNTHLAAYIDGRQTNLVECNGMTEHETFRIGGFHNLLTFNGSIDDVIAFNRSLTEEEIKGLYANQSPRYIAPNITGLRGGIHTFISYAQDQEGNINYTEERDVGLFYLPNLGFSTPTPPDDDTQEEDFVTINISAFGSLFETFRFNWNGTNYTIFNGSAVLYMNFDNRSELGENDVLVVDLTGNGHNATVEGAAVSAGKYYGGFDFDGQDDYMNISGITGINQTMAFSVWVAPDSWGGYILGKGRANSTDLVLNLSSRDVLIYGNEHDSGTPDSIGMSVASADLNNDSFDDVIIGGHSATGWAGRTYIFFGPLNESAEMNCSLANATVLGAAGGDISAIDVGSGDLNNDGVDDLIIGAYWADGPGDGWTNGGETHVIYGPISSGSHSLSDSNITFYSTTDDDAFGTSVASGDFNNDSIADLLSGAYEAEGTDSSPSEAGETYIFYGPLEKTGTFTVSTANVTFYGKDEDDQSGTGAASGDFNNDGVDDVMIGAWYAEGAGSSPSAAGETYIFFGPIADSGAFNLSDADVTYYGNNSNDCSGWSIGSVDMNNDGIDDVLIGGVYAEGAGGTSSGEGETYIFYGPTQTGEINLLDANITLYGAAQSDSSGSGVGSGDFNNDGIDDLIVGAFQSEHESSPDSAGQAYIFYGPMQIDEEFSLKLDSRGRPVASFGASAVQSDVVLAKGEYAQITAVAESGTIGLYVNGQNLANVSGTLNISDNDLIIGSMDGRSGFFNGTIDELSIWNISLSADEVRQHYFTNLYQYNSTQWYMYMNQSKTAADGLDPGTYSYYAYAKNSFGEEGSTEERDITILSLEISSCQVLDKPDSVYTMTADIDDNTVSNNCLNITAENVTIDCAGFSITSSQDAAGIYSDQNHTTIRDCNISMGGMFGIGIDLSGANESLVYNNTCSDQSSGIRLLYVIDTLIENNTADSNSVTGIYLGQGSRYNNITSNTLGDNSQGIEISDAHYNMIINNTAIENGDGFRLISTSSYNFLQNNTARSNGDGYYLHDSHHNNFSDNKCWNSTASACLYLWEAQNNSISGGSLNLSSGNLIYLRTDSKWNNLSDIVLDNSSDWAVYAMSGSDSNMFVNLSISNIDTVGIMLESVVGTELINNTFSETSVSIYLNNSNVDGYEIIGGSLLITNPYGTIRFINTSLNVSGTNLYEVIKITRNSGFVEVDAD